MLAQEAQVIIRPMHNQFMARESLKHGSKIQTGQRIQQPIAETGADLDETHFFGISMQTVRLGIDRDPTGLAQSREELLKLFFRVNHNQIIYGRSAKGPFGNGLHQPRNNVSWFESISVLTH